MQSVEAVVRGMPSLPVSLHIWYVLYKYIRGRSSHPQLTLAHLRPLRQAYTPQWDAEASMLTGNCRPRLQTRSPRREDRKQTFWKLF